MPKDNYSKYRITKDQLQEQFNQAVKDLVPVQTEDNPEMESQMRGIMRVAEIVLGAHGAEKLWAVYLAAKHDEQMPKFYEK